MDESLPVQALSSDGSDLDGSLNIISSAVPDTNNSLEALASEEQRNILNIVDRLRQCGLDGILSLPQLVVCGDQSSGKSSVLEAITEIPFPRKENLCTRFATEIILRRTNVTSIAVKIIPDDKRPASKQTELKSWVRSIDDFSTLPELIDDATIAMGLDNSGEGIKKAFAKDVLSIEISGPNRPQLTLVDLPGLVHSENKQQSKQDLEMVSELVQQYIEQPHTIILPVISAMNDYANQIILERARKVDPTGSRTLGIITKPDTLHPGSEMEAAFISLSKNEDIFFSLGWHILRNRGFQERDYSFLERYAAEESFFSKGRWAELSADMLGIESLRARLSKLLFQHIKQDLPRLRDDLEQKYEATMKTLETLGHKRNTEGEIRQYLMQLSTTFKDIAKAAVEGHYQAPYFSSVDVHSKMTSLKERRLRARIQYLNTQFASQMRKCGQKYRIGTGKVSPHYREEVVEGEEEDEGNLDAFYLQQAPEQTYMSKDNALTWIREILIRTRGVELSGNFNPLLISELFWEQSLNWESLASGHAEGISKLCRNFVYDLIDEICPPDVAGRLKSSFVSDALKKRSAKAMGELKELLDDKRRQPMTYNHYYTTTIQKRRQDRVHGDLEESLSGAEENVCIQSQGYKKMTDTAKFRKLVGEKIEPNMDKVSAADALDALESYYKTALKTFVDNITTQVIERHIVYDLESIFSPLVVSAWNPEELMAVASEPVTISRQRDFNEGRRRMFEEGREVFGDVLRRGGMD